MDTYFMERALELARKGKGRTPPNPCVGAVITRGGEILGEGWHRFYGGPHAEIEAISDARAKRHNIKGATLWVTLEPCNHQGKTPPCTHAIVEEGINKVVIGSLDPNPLVKGGGAQFLKNKGIEVITGVKKEKTEELIRDFKVWILKKRPYVILKMAQTLDGKIATRDGDSRWVSCASSRDMVHILRNSADAIMIGAKTLLKDNPRLTIRRKGKSVKKHPLAIVVGTTPPPLQKRLFLLSDRIKETLFWTNNRDPSQWQKWREKGLDVWELPLTEGNHIDLAKGLSRLFEEKKCYYLVCEGGGVLAGSLIKQAIVDELQLFISPKLLGDERAMNSFVGINIFSMKSALLWDIVDTKRIGRDLWMRLFPLFGNRL